MRVPQEVTPKGEGKQTNAPRGQLWLAHSPPMTSAAMTLG